MTEPPRPAWVTAGIPPAGGRIREAPEDFEVEELPAYAPSGEGEHLYLWIEKRGLDTPAVARALARQLGIPEREVAYAGLKDRHAVTRQLFSVPSRLEAKVAGLSLEGARVLWARRHGNKLRIGHLHGNRFRIRIRSLLDPAAAQASFRTLCERGLPNFFGPQRFGARGDNALAGLMLLKGQRLPAKPDRFRRRLFLSAIQADLFNAALEARVGGGTWDRALLGDVLRKAENGGLFVCERPEEDQPRVDRFEVSPAGPMFGPKMLQARGAVGEAERALLAARGLSASDFVRGGEETQGARRAYRVRLGAPSFAREGADAVLSFELPRGSYATVLLAEIQKGGGELGDEGDAEP